MSLCPACGAFPVKRLALVCELCLAVLPPNPEHIKPIVERVMDDLFDDEKDAA